MIILGVTGSIAMGKSTVSTMLSHLNNPIHDADKTVHELMDVNGKAYYKIAKNFPGTVQVNGVDRAKLGQEVFVLNQTNHKKEGTFVDIGGGHPELINNTLTLEKDYGWKGISLDIGPPYP